MTTPLKDLQVAFWTHLNNQPEYTALGLKEFRFYNGVLLPFDWANRRISDSALPAHSAQITSGGREKVDDIEGRFRSFVALQIAVIFRASEGDATLGIEALDNAMSVITDTLDARSKRQALAALLDGEFEWGLRGGPQIGREPDSGTPRLWAQVYDVTLFGRGRQIN